MTGSCPECEKNKLLGKPLQPKLAISEPGDVYEQEADRVAEQVIRLPEPFSEKNVRESSTMQVQRKVSGNSSGIGTALPIVHDVLNSPGQALDPATRAFFEPRFGHDFSQVRVHRDERAEQSARDVSAVAYTVGHNIVFARGQYAPHTTMGQRLIAHELTHVAQQGAAEHLSAVPRKNSDRTRETATFSSHIQGSAMPHRVVLQRQPAARITAPVPRGATVNRQGQASFQINGINVIAEPDRNSADAAMRNKAETKFGLVIDRDADGQYDSRTDTVTSVTPPIIHATVFTVFGPSYDPRRAAVYGRGTTAADQRAGNTNLGFHESRHGADWFDFLGRNAAPVFSGKVGMSLDDFIKAREQFHNDINQYNSRAQDYTKRLTDCTGTLPRERNLATFCRQQTP